MYKFEIFKDSEGQFRFRFVAPNGEITFPEAEQWARDP